MEPIATSDFILIIILGVPALLFNFAWWYLARRDPDGYLTLIKAFPWMKKYTDEWLLKRAKYAFPIVFSIFVLYLVCAILIGVSSSP